MMMMVTGTFRAWLLALLLIAGGPLAPRVCADCPPGDHAPAAAVAADEHACCADRTPRPDRNRAPADPDEDRPQGCDCPPGCCTLGFGKAMAAQDYAVPDFAADGAWDLPARRARSGPGSDGPRRPPRA